VATNRSGFLTKAGSRLQVIARFPTEASYPAPAPADPRGLAFAVAGQVGPGRVLIMADHSVFINAMLWPKDNQNLDFAINCVDWLTEHGRRQRVYFVDEGNPQTMFDIPLEELPAPSWPPPEALIDTFDQVMAGLERENRFNELIATMPGNLPTKRAVALTFVCLSFVLGLIALQRLNSAKHRRESGIVPLAATVDKLELGRPMHELRTDALTERGNYWEAAHELAIDVFEPLLSAAAPGNRLRADAAGSLWKRWRWRRQVRAVWRLAVEPKPRRWTRKQWLRLHALDQPLRRDIALGKISLVPTSSNLDHAPSKDGLSKFHSAR
jgi:hypothetical protein